MIRVVRVYFYMPTITKIAAIIHTVIAGNRKKYIKPDNNHTTKARFKLYNISFGRIFRVQVFARFIAPTFESGFDDIVVSQEFSGL